MLLPNKSEVAGASTNQSFPDARDIDIMVSGGANYGIASGGAVTAQASPDGTVAIAPAQLVFSPPGAAQINISIGAQSIGVLTGTGSAAADPTNPRIDYVVCSSTGVISVLHGVPAAITSTSAPVAPTRAAIGTDANGNINKVVLARIDVRPGVTTIIATDIVDKRYFPQPPIIPPLAGAQAIVVFPGQFNQSMVTLGGPGAAFILKAGVHPQANVVPLNGQTFIGEPGAILDGGMITRTVTLKAGSTGTTLFTQEADFVAADVAAFGTTPTFIGGGWFANTGQVLITAQSGSSCTLNNAINGGRTFSDGVTANGSATITSASLGAFTSLDVGALITSANGVIPANSYIGIVNSATSIGISSSPTANVPVNCTATTPGVITVTQVYAQNTTASNGRSATDVVTTNTSKTITSASLAQFTIADVGAWISGTNIPANTLITSVVTAPYGTNGASSATLSKACTGSGTVTATMKQATGTVLTLTRPPTSTCTSAFQYGSTGKPINITIKNLIVQNYASPPQRGGIHAEFSTNGLYGDNWLIENCEVRNCSYSGIQGCDNMTIRNCLLHDNGDMGISLSGHGMLVENNEIYSNNSYNSQAGFDGAGLKGGLANHGMIRHNRVHNNQGGGLWLDVDCMGNWIINNTVTDNAGSGIFVETSYATKVFSNTCIANGKPNSTSAAFDPCNILISSSSAVEVAYNIVGSLAQGNYNGIHVLAQDRQKIGGTQRSVTDAVTANASSTLTSATAAFTQADLYARVYNTSGTNVINFQSAITTIIDVVNSTTVTLSNPSTGANTQVGIIQAADLGGIVPGLATYQQSGWEQRAYDIEIHHNWVTTTGTSVMLGGMACDYSGITANSSIWKLEGIRWHDNSYSYSHGGDRFAWQQATMTVAQWQGAGMDTSYLVDAPTGYVPANELRFAPPDTVGTDWKDDYLSSTVVTNISGTPTVDLSTGTHQRLTLNGNVTGTIVFSNIPAQGPVTIEFIQDGTGSRTRTTTQPTNVKLSGGVWPTITATASKRDVHVFSADASSGTNTLIEISRLQNI